MVVYLCEYTKNHWIYTLNQWIEWHVNYTPINTVNGLYICDFYV